jgi:hypothetical protein
LDAAVTEPFDPYRDWLRIDAARPAINHYRLFGLRVFESDAKTIANAASETIARIEALNPGPQAAAREQLLAELAAAQRSLIDPASRAKYDAGLRSRLKGVPAAMPAAAPIEQAIPAANPAPSAAALPRAIPLAIPVAPAVAVTSAPTDADPWDSLTASGAHRRRRAQAQSKCAWVLGVTALACAVTAAGGFAIWQALNNSGPAGQTELAATLQGNADADHVTPKINSSAPDKKTAPAAAPDPSSTKNPSVAASSVAGSSIGNTAAVQKPPAETNKTQSPSADIKTSPDRSTTFQRAMNRARRALVVRDLKGAARALDAAETRAQSFAERSELKRFRALVHELDLFFAALGAGMRKLEATDELPVGDSFVIVIESGPETVAVRAEGSRHDYTLATLPAKIALVVAEGGADPSLPKVQLFRGAFLAVDPQGDRDASRELWQSAAAAGESVDDLLPFLEASALALEREPAPDAALLAQAEQTVGNTFSKAIAAAKSRPKKSELAAKLMQAAAEAENSAEQFAALQQARGLWAAAGDGAGACQAIDELAAWFDVDALAIKSETLAAASTSATGAGAKQIAAAALDLADEAKSANRGELAASFIATAESMARKARDSELLNRAKERRKQLAPPVKKPARPAAVKKNS